MVDFCFERWTMSEMRQGALQNRIYQVDFRVNVLWESWLRINVYKVIATLNFKHFLFIKYIYCMFWCVFLVNILKYGKISSLRVSIYSALLVILQSYTQTVSWSMFSYPVMDVIGIKKIFNREIAFLWWVRIKPKVLNNIFP